MCPAECQKRERAFGSAAEGHRDGVQGDRIILVFLTDPGRRLHQVFDVESFVPVLRERMYSKDR